MKNIEKLLMSALVAGISFTACQKFDETARVDDNGGHMQVPAMDTTRFYPGVVRIKVTEEYSRLLEAEADERGVVAATKSSALFGTLSIKSMERTFPYAGKFEKRTRERGMHLWYDVKLAEDSPATKAQAEFVDMDGVTIVELCPKANRGDYMITPAGTAWQARNNRSSEDLPFNDPRLPEQWHYINDGSMENTVAGCDINVKKVWTDYTTGDKDVIVAILDGGVDADHEDLKDNMWINEAEYNGAPGVDDDGNGYVDDVYGYNFYDISSEIQPDDHGTHVAGTVAAVNNNGIGVSGVAGGNYAEGTHGASIMTCQIFGLDGNLGNFGRAIKYAADNGAVIAQNSWNNNVDDQISPSNQEAVDYFIDFAGIDEHGNQTGPMKGGIVIFAAGNNNEAAARPPATYSRILCVSSVGADFTKASYSNYNKYVDIAGPGGDIENNQGVLSTIVMENGGYGIKNGTSMACPHVSGVAALLVSEYGGDGFTPDQLRRKLIYSGTNVDRYNQGTQWEGGLGKLVNAYMAMTGTGSEVAPEPVTDLSIETKSNSLVATWTATTDEDDVTPLGYALCYSTESFDTSDPSNLPESVTISNFEGGWHVGESAQGQVKRLEFETKYYVSMYAYDMASNYSEMSSLKEIVTGINNPPEADVNEIDMTMKVGDVKTMEVDFYDPDGHDVSYSIVRGSSVLSDEKLEAGKVRLVFDATDALPGNYQGRMTVRDEYSMSLEIPIKYSVTGAHDPSAIKDFEDLAFEEGSQAAVFELDEYFEDLDGEYLVYSAESSDENVATAVVDDSELTVSPVSSGEATVTVTATDTGGASLSVSFNVKVGGGSSERPAIETPVEAYPNPVSKYLYIGVKEDVHGRIVLVSPLGHKLIDETADLKASEPYEIDMSSYPAGTYSVKVETGDDVYSRNIVKL